MFSLIFNFEKLNLSHTFGIQLKSFQTKLYRAEISLQIEKSKEKEIEFQQSLSDLDAQKVRTEKALDQIQVIYLYKDLKKLKLKN